MNAQRWTLKKFITEKFNAQRWKLKTKNFYISFFKDENMKNSKFKIITSTFKPWLLWNFIDNDEKWINPCVLYNIFWVMLLYIIIAFKFFFFWPSKSSSIKWDTVLFTRSKKIKSPELSSLGSATNEIC